MKGRIERGFLKVGTKRCACIDCLEGVTVSDGLMTVYYWYDVVNVKHDKLVMEYDEKLHQTIIEIMEARGIL